jgi:hypothetical protein
MQQAAARMQHPTVWNYENRAVPRDELGFNTTNATLQKAGGGGVGKTVTGLTAALR